eukprot:TRINITY_DN16743_c0_g1_i1.p1 TRINITY_DN16743_c0_g1~~TRINITY_DN16743_c0_g1_i1.p1  ORF type:complete len:1548 (+),score=268.62 TRINITY_DN16743_c0_g1_i1:146-4789(+)
MAMTPPPHAAAALSPGALSALSILSSPGAKEGLAGRSPGKGASLRKHQLTWRRKRAPKVQKEAEEVPEPAAPPQPPSPRHSLTVKDRAYLESVYFAHEGIDTPKLYHIFRLHQLPPPSGEDVAQEVARCQGSRFLSLAAFENLMAAAKALLAAEVAGSALSNAFDVYQALGNGAPVDKAALSDRLQDEFIVDVAGSGICPDAPQMTQADFEAVLAASRNPALVAKFVRCGAREDVTGSLTMTTAQLRARPRLAQEHFPRVPRDVLRHVYAECDARCNGMLDVDVFERLVTWVTTASDPASVKDKLDKVLKKKDSNMTAERIRGVKILDDIARRPRRVRRGSDCGSECSSRYGGAGDCVSEGSLSTRHDSALLARGSPRKERSFKRGGAARRQHEGGAADDFSEALCPTPPAHGLSAQHPGRRRRLSGCSSQGPHSSGTETPSIHSPASAQGSDACVTFEEGRVEDTVPRTDDGRDGQDGGDGAAETARRHAMPYPSGGRATPGLTRPVAPRFRVPHHSDAVFRPSRGMCRFKHSRSWWAAPGSPAAGPSSPSPALSPRVRTPRSPMARRTDCSHLPKEVKLWVEAGSGRAKWVPRRPSSPRAPSLALPSPCSNVPDGSDDLNLTSIALEGVMLDERDAASPRHDACPGSVGGTPSFAAGAEPQTRLFRLVDRQRVTDTCAVVVQMFARTAAAARLRWYVSRGPAIAVIQRAMRVGRARRHFRRVQTSLTAHLHDAAAHENAVDGAVCLLQRWWRGAAVRRGVFPALAAQRRHAAVVQSAARAALSSRRVAAAKAAARRRCAASSMQRCVRRHLAAVRTHALGTAVRCAHDLRVVAEDGLCGPFGQVCLMAVVRLQAWARGMKSRRAARALHARVGHGVDQRLIAEAGRDLDAFLTAPARQAGAALQRWLRGRAARARVATFRARLRAAWDRRVVNEGGRRGCERLHAVHVLQRFARCSRARAALRTRRADCSAATLARTRYERDARRNDAALTIQLFVRGRRAQVAASTRRSALAELHDLRIVAEGGALVAPGGTVAHSAHCIQRMVRCWRARCHRAALAQSLLCAVDRRVLSESGSAVGAAGAAWVAALWRIARGHAARRQLCALKRDAEAKRAENIMRSGCGRKSMSFVASCTVQRVGRGQRGRALLRAQCTYAPSPCTRGAQAVPGPDPAVNISSGARRTLSPVLTPALSSLQAAGGDRQGLTAQMLRKQEAAATARVLKALSSMACTAVDNDGKGTGGDADAAQRTADGEQKAASASVPPPPTSSSPLETASSPLTPVLLQTPAAGASEGVAARPLLAEEEAAKTQAVTVISALSSCSSDAPHAAGHEAAEGSVDAPAVPSGATAADNAAPDPVECCQDASTLPSPGSPQILRSLPPALSSLLKAAGGGGAEGLTVRMLRAQEAVQRVRTLQNVVYAAAGPAGGGNAAGDAPQVQDAAAPAAECGSSDDEASDAASTEEIAVGFYEALQGAPVDVGTLCYLLGFVQSARHWHGVAAAYARLREDAHERGLVHTLKRTLLRDEYVQCAQVLREKGVDIDTAMRA